MNENLINSPDHYLNNGLESRDIIRYFGELINCDNKLYGHGVPPIHFFYLGNTIKYLCRYPKKDDPIGDLLKAKRYIDMIIEDLELVDNINHYN